MRWYDLFAGWYDALLDGTYRAHRHQAAEALAVSSGMTVVDVGCGTGASFPHLVDGVGQEGRVIGVDASNGMLAAAHRRVQRNRWSNVSLMRADELQEMSLLHPYRPDRVLFCLSLSVIPAWESVLLHWYDQLAPGGRLVIADVYNARPGAYARVVEAVAQASLRRRSWLPISERTPAFSLTWMPSSWVLGGQFFVSCGTKPPGSSAHEASQRPLNEEGCC